MMLPGLFIVLGSLSVSVPDQPQWERYSPPDARFEVSMPSKPTVSVKYIQREKDVIPVHMVSANRYSTESFPFTGPSDDFFVSWTDYSKAAKKPSASSKTFNAMRDALANARNATVICDHTVSLNGAPGRSLTLKTEDEQILDVVFYVAQNRVYQVMAQTRNSDTMEEDRDRFLSSFRLIS